MSTSPNGRTYSRNVLPSLADVVFLGVLFFLTVGDETLLGDADTGYHVRAGEFIIDHWQIPHSDIFSFLTPALPWTLHEWLSEIIMALVHRQAGLTGIGILFSFMIALSAYLVFELLLKERGNILLAAAAALLVVLSSASNWLARPHVFTFLFVIVFYHLLNLYQDRDRNYLFLLPPMTLVWVNLHGGFIVGILLLGVYLTGNLAGLVWESPSRRTVLREKSRWLAVTTVACLCAAVLNPYGYKTLLFPFRVVQDRFLMDHIAEYLSPNFHFSSVVPFEIMLLGALAVFAVSGAKLNMIELALLILFAHMSLFSSRHIPLFAIVAGPIVLKQAQLLFDQPKGRVMAALRARIDNLAAIDRSSVRWLWPAGGVLLVLLLAKAGLVNYAFNDRHVPVKAVEFLQREPIAGNMFNNDEFGDYVIYAAWPRYKVFIDGRTDMYGANRVREYLKISRAEAGWEELAERYQLTWILHHADSTLSKVLRERSDWRLVYADELAHIFVKALPQYDPLIRRYAAPQPGAQENPYTN